MNYENLINEKIESYLSQKYQNMANCTKISTNQLIAELGLFLTIKDLQEILKVSRPTIERYIRQQSLPAAKIGRQYRIRTPDFVEWWNEQVEQGRRDLIKGIL